MSERNIVEIRLTFYEVMSAALVGTMRQVDNLKKGKRHRYGTDNADSWTKHIEGACAEMALAKHLGLFWSGNVGDHDAPDVAGFQVRQTAYATGHLMLHPDDKDHEIFVLATGTAPKFVLRGWLLAGDGKHEQHWRDPTKQNKPAYFVPQNLLHGMTSLLQGEPT